MLTDHNDTHVEKDTDNGLAAGWIVLIVLGSIAIILIAAVLFTFIKNKKCTLSRVDKIPGEEPAADRPVSVQETKADPENPVALPSPHVHHKHQITEDATAQPLDNSSFRPFTDRTQNEIIGLNGGTSSLGKINEEEKGGEA